jgi:cysteine desulfurase
LQLGGGQERGRRGGTPALPAIAAFAAAALAATPEDAARLAPLRDAIEAAAMAAGAQLIGAGAPRLPNTSCLALSGVRSESQVITLDLAGLAVSAGAACSSGKVARSHVLEAMGLGPLAGEAIRVSLPWNAQPAHVAAFAEAYRAMAQRMVRRAA